MLLVVEQFLNGLQFGLLLFLLAAGLTLVFGIMDFVNLAHGSLYMMGAYFAATFVAWTGNFVIGVLLALGATLLLGIVLEFVALRHLYGRDHPDHARHLLSRLPAGDHRGRPRGRPAAVCRRDAYPTRHADPRRRLQPGNDRRARHQHQAALHLGVRAWCRACRPRRADASADPYRPDRDGREHPDPCFRHHRDRRHRLDPRRIPGRDLRRHDRYAGPCVPARPAAADPELDRGFHRGARAVLDADLSVDGHGAGGAARGAVSGQPSMTASLNARNAIAALVVAGLLLLPLYTSMSGNIFMLTLFTRIVIFALAAASLNLIMGYGGMMSFGHAAYLGIGGYAVGILAHEGIGSGVIQWPVALAASALFALVVGALSLRTRGVYFIMITLAFAQMAYYIASGLARYGGDDGLTIYKRSTFGGLINLSSRVQFYYLCLGCLFGGIYLIWRIVNSRFGMVVQGLRSNEARMQAIGFPASRYRLVCFVIAGTMCGLAGALLANNTDFVSPAVMYWTRSGDLMVMVILGGMGTLFGPVIGAVVYLLLEELLSQITEYWALIMGPLLLLIVLFGRGGIMGLLGRF